MWRMFANIYLYLPLIFSIGEKQHVVEYDKLRFQPEIICNAVCEECLQISIYIYPLFSQMVSQNMLLSMINSYFSEKSFVMLYVKNVCKYLFIFTPYFLKWCLKRHVVEYDKLRFQPEIICNVVCEECLQISLYIYHLFSQMVSGDMLLSMINSDFSQKLFLMLYVKNVCKYLFIFTPYFLKWCLKTCCWVW